MPKVSKLTRKQAAEKVIEGLKKHYAAWGPFVLADTSYSEGELVALFQAQVDAIDAVDRARAALSDAVDKERQVARGLQDLARRLKTRVGVTAGPSAKVHGDFGWRVPKKPGPKTVKGKVEGALRSRATRTARGTMGSRQRKKIRA